MPDQYAPVPRITADDIETPIAEAAMDAIDAYIGQRDPTGAVNVALARQRIAAMRSYLHIVEDELQNTRLWGNQLCLNLQGEPS